MPKKNAATAKPLPRSGAHMDLMQKLAILTDGAKYDVACTSSGVTRAGGNGLGSTLAAGCCHSFSADGRCISLLKVLLTNHCIYDCRYCVNRSSSDTPRAAFTPEELAQLTIEFYRRNYIEGLFLSSGVVQSPDHTMELMIRSLELLRRRHNFWGYIHAKTIPGASGDLVRRLGLLADRLSVNIELPSEQSLGLLAPHKTRRAILSPMGLIAQGMAAHRQEAATYRNAPRFAPAGQATQMIIGASPESDHRILTLAEALYRRYRLKRVFYSAYIPAVADSLLPSTDTKPPLLREHRLYQADFLMRQYGFSADELLSEAAPNFNPFLDPKCDWAIRHMHLFPVDLDSAPKEMLLRVPGIGPLGAGRILAARRAQRLGEAELKRMGIVWKRAKHFVTAHNYTPGPYRDKAAIARTLIDPRLFSGGAEQLSMFLPGNGLQLPGPGDVANIAQAAEEAVLCLTKAL